MRFLQAAESLFFKGASTLCHFGSPLPIDEAAHASLSGWQLGSDPEIQVATLVSNHLTAGLIKYFGDSYRFERVVNLFERLLPLSPEVAALLATSYIGMSKWRTFLDLDKV